MQIWLLPPPFLWTSSQGSPNTSILIWPPWCLTCQRLTFCSRGFCHPTSPRFFCLSDSVPCFSGFVMLRICLYSLYFLHDPSQWFSSMVPHMASTFFGNSLKMWAYWIKFRGWAQHSSQPLWVVEVLAQVWVLSNTLETQISELTFSEAPTVFPASSWAAPSWYPA